MEALTEDKILDQNEMKSVLDELFGFAKTDTFVALHKEMMSQPYEERGEFVKKVLLNEEALKKRGVILPDGILIQRSYFTDDRPTLFCLVKYLKDGKRKLTVTYDNDWK